MARDTGQWRWSISSAAPDGPSPSLLHCIIVSISWHGACSLMGQGGEEEEEEGGVGWGVHGGYIGEEWGLGVGGSVKRSCEWHAMHSTPPINFSVSTATATRVGAPPPPPPLPFTVPSSRCPSYCCVGRRGGWRTADWTTSLSSWALSNGTGPK